MTLPRRTPARWIYMPPRTPAYRVCAIHRFLPRRTPARVAELLLQSTPIEKECAVAHPPIPPPVVIRRKRPTEHAGCALTVQRIGRSGWSATAKRLDGRGEASLMPLADERTAWLKIMELAERLTGRAQRRDRAKWNRAVRRTPVKDGQREYLPIVAHFDIDGFLEA